MLLVGSVSIGDVLEQGVLMMGLRVVGIRVAVWELLAAIDGGDWKLIPLVEM